MTYLTTGDAGSPFDKGQKLIEQDVWHLPGKNQIRTVCCAT